MKFISSSVTQRVKFILFLKCKNYCADNTCDITCSIEKYGCFSGTTIVQSIDGKKPISLIKEGDKVLSYNHQTNKKEYKAVTALHSYIVSTILAMVFTIGDTLWATPNHPFWFKEAYVEASTLEVGDTLHTLDGTYKIIQEIITYDKPERVYNLTVADNNNYVVTAEGILVHNTCFLARVSDSPGLISKIDALPEELKAAFIKDFYNAGDEVVGLFKKNPEFVKAWETLIDHPLIRKDVATLTSASKILDNTGIANIISKADLQTTVQKLAEKGVRCRTCTSGNPAYRYMDEILDDLEHGASKFGNEYTSVITGIKQGGNFTEGAIFVADGVRRYGDDFPPGTVFEFTEVTPGGVRRVDVRVPNGFGGNKDVFFEFKSVQDVPHSGFATQFVKDMDLSDVIDLNQLKWWFDGKKVSSLPKQQFLDALENSTIDQLIINKFVTSTPKNKQALIDLIDDNFETIFTIK